MKSNSKNDRWYGGFFFVLSLLGIGDTTYLYVQHLQGSEGVCLFTQGCDTVLGSTYANVLGAPTAFWGLIFYLLVFVSTVVFFATGSKHVLYSIFALSIVGFCVSLALFYLQAFVLGAFCEFCILSAVTSTLIFTTGVVLMVRNHRDVFRKICNKL